MAYASWHTTVTDLQGNVIPNASIYVVNETTGIAPQLYADRQGLVPMGNPFTAEADGTVNLYVAGGAYRIRASFGAWERTWRYVGIGTAQEVDVEGLASMLQSGFSPVQTLADLNAITPAEFPAGGIVLADPVGSNNGYYTNSGSGWVYSRPLPDTFARLYATGGSANNVQATLDAGVNPSSPTVFFIDVTTPNTGPVTLTVNGANTGPVLNAAGNPLAAGEWQGRVLFTRESNGDYKILNDPASALSAALSATQAGSARDAAVTARNEAQAARTGAETAQSAAESSADDAASSAGAAASSASSASTSATNAANSASSASGSASTATAQAGIATTQAGNAASSASAAATSATSAGNSAIAAASSATTAEQQADRAEEEADRAEAAAASVGNVVTYTPQTPTPAEQAQARENLGIGDGLPIGAVLFDPRGLGWDGYLELNGSSFDTGVYPDLAALYPSGVLPDFTDRVARGAGPLAGAAGTTQEDAAQRIEGSIIGWAGSVAIVRTNAMLEGAFTAIAKGTGSTTSGSAESSLAATLKFDNATSPGARVSNDETRVKAVVGKWYIKAYGVINSAGEADIVAIEQAQQFMVRFDEQTLAPAAQSQVQENIGLADVSREPKVTIQHIRTGAYNYERIVISGGPNALQKKPGLNFNPVTGQFNRQALSNYAKQRGYRVAINCEADNSVGGGLFKPANLDIFDGVPYQNFTPASEFTREAIIMRRDGSLVPARATDGKTAQDYVNEGALWSTGHGPLLVVDGVGQDISAFTTATQISARTVLGRRPNGDYVILMVEGDTGSYGITGNNLVALCLSEGLEIAMNLDGGGSTQCWWDCYWSHPSSDIEPRARGHHLSIDLSSVPTFDTGVISVPVETGVTSLDGDIPRLSVRQVGGSVFVNYAATVTLGANTNVLLTSQFPKRFLPETPGFLRTILQGGNGVPVAVIASGGTPSNVTLRAQAAATYAIGGSCHPAKWAGTPSV